jgi:hypothetical protein
MLLTRDDKEATENFKWVGKDRCWIGGVLQGEPVRQPSASGMGGMK